MKRREMLVATGTVAATALAGCIGSDIPGGNQNGGANPDGGATPGNARTITVSSEGDAKGEPDLAILHVGVETTADTAQDARADLAQRAEDVRTALLDAGLDEDQVTTQRFTIRERLDRRQMEIDGVRPDSPEALEEYTYYEGTHAFTVEVSDVDAVGDVIDTAVGAGANNIDRVTFTLSEEKRATLRKKALREAIQNARSEAEVIAEEVGASIVEATVVDASDARVSPVHRDLAFAQETAAPGGDGGGVPTDVQPSDVTVTANVHVRYRME